MEKMNLDGGRKDLRWSRVFQEANGYPKLICNSSKPFSSISSIYTCSSKFLKFAHKKKKSSHKNTQKELFSSYILFSLKYFQRVTFRERVGSSICFCPKPSSLPLQVSCSRLFCHVFSSLSSCQMESFSDFAHVDM